MTHQENVQLMSKRIQDRDLQQYFNNFSQGEIKQISKSINQDDADSVAEILLDNINIHGQSLSTFFEGAYDSQYLDLGTQFVEDFLKEKILETRQAIQNKDINELSNILDEIDFNFPEGLRRNANKLKSGIKEAISRLSLPKKSEVLAKKLARQKGIKLNKKVNYSRIKKWKNGKIVLEIRRVDNNRWVTYKFIDKKDLVTRKRDLPKIDFDEPIEVTPKKPKLFKKSLRGKPLTWKEKKFIDYRLEDDFEKIWLDYEEFFGNVRTKTELKRLTNERR